LKFLKSLWSFARNLEWIDNAPFKTIKHRKTEKEIMEIPNKEEVKKFISWCMENGEEEMGYYVKILYLTGVRSYELNHLTWKDVDLKGKKIRVWSKKQEDQKSVSRNIPLTPSLVDIFLIRQDQNKILKSKWVFPWNSQGINEDMIQYYKKPYGLKEKKLVKIFKKSGLTPFKLHSLRHLFTISLAKKNVPIVDIMGLTGHSQLSTLTRYVSGVVNGQEVEHHTDLIDF